MAETLFFRFQDDQVESVHFDARGQLIDYRLGSLESFNEDTSDFTGKVILVVPGEDVLLTSANIPSKQQRQIVQAVPYAVEEDLADDVEDCVFAVGSRDAEGAVRVAVVSKSIMSAWLEALATIDLNVTIMIPENALAAGPDCKVIVDGERIHIGWSESRAVTANQSDLPLYASLVAGDREILIAGRTESLSRSISELEASGCALKIESDEDPGFQTLCLSYSGQQINLLQGEYRVEERGSSQVSVWRSAAILFAVALFLQLALQVSQGWYLTSKADGFLADSKALYEEIFPQDRNVRDIRRRWNSHLGQSAGGDHVFIGLFARSARGLTAAGLTLENVNFNESRGDLILQVSGVRSETLVEYVQVLSGQGLNAEIGTISQEGGAVRGSIKIRARGSSS